eukprot:gene19566-25466_t
MSNNNESKSNNNGDNDTVSEDENVSNNVLMSSIPFIKQSSDDEKIKTRSSSLAYLSNDRESEIITDMYTDARYKRKKRFTSTVWDHFSIVEIEGGGEKACCNYCKHYFATGKGTSSLQYHLKACSEFKILDNNEEGNPNNDSDTNALLNSIRREKRARRKSLNDDEEKVIQSLINLIQPQLNRIEIKVDNSIAMLWNSKCIDANDKLKPVSSLISNNFPSDIYPETLGELLNLSEVKVIILENYYGIESNGSLEERKLALKEIIGCF